MSTTDKKTEEKNVQVRELTGTVVSDASDKTVVVSVERRLRHKLYGKLFSRTRKFHAHDEQNTFKTGDTVTIVQCRPMSKKKRWRVVYNETPQA